MKTTIGIFALFALALAAPAADKKKVAAKPAGPTAQILTIPKEATPLADGTFSWTDKDGKKWLYAKTPFGVMRSAATDPSAEAAPATASATTIQFTKAMDKGETVKFERASPFGPIVWEKKKADLTSEEKSILDHQTAKPQ